MPAKPSSATLPTASGQAGDFLVSRDGAPVWPIADEADAAALHRIAAACDASTSCAEAFPRRRERPTSRQCVIALGAEVEGEARLYAHLTGRAVRCLSDVASVVGGRRPAVLVTTEERLTPELLRWLYDGRNAPGIVCGAPGTVLRRQVLVRTAAAALISAGPVHARAVLPTSAFHHFAEGGLELAGRAASASVRRRMMAAGSGVLAIMTHSDGIDAFLGPDLTACSLLGRVGDSRPTTGPRCAVTRWCHRHDGSIQEVLASDSVVEPGAMAAHILVWDVCFGVLPAGSLVNFYDSIGSSLLASASVGALVTNWQIVVSSPDTALRLMREIAAGVPVGQAVGRLNRSVPRPSRSHPMCLFGDPRTRLAVAGASPRPKSLASAPDRRRQGGLASPLARLRMVVASTDARASEAGDCALRAIETLESCVAAGVPFGTLPRSKRAGMRDAVLRYAMARGKLLDAWLAYARRLDRAAHGRCPACGRETDRFEAIFDGPADAARRLVLCPICGLIEDAPLSSQLRFTLAGRKLTLHGTTSGRERTIGVLIASPYPADTIQLRWPLDENSVARRSAFLPEALPVGLLRLSVIVVDDTDATILSRMVRGSDAILES